MRWQRTGPSGPVRGMGEMDVMASQWPLMVATLLTGMAGWLIVAACARMLAPGKHVRVRVRPPQVLALALAIAGIAGGIAVEGVALGSASALFQLLARPGSHMFYLMVSMLVALAVSIVALVASSRGVSSGVMRTLGVLGILAGIMVAVSGGYVFIPSTFTAWNTPLLPLALAGSSATLGGALYLVLEVALSKPDAAPASVSSVSASNENLSSEVAATSSGAARPSRRPLRVRLLVPCALTVVLCIVGVACTIPFLAVTGTKQGDTSALMLALCLVGLVGAAALAAAAFFARGHKGACLALALLAAALGVLAVVALRFYLSDFAVNAFTQVSSLTSPAGRL